MRRLKEGLVYVFEKAFETGSNTIIFHHLHHLYEYVRAYQRTLMW